VVRASNAGSVAGVLGEGRVGFAFGRFGWRRARGDALGLADCGGLGNSVCCFLVFVLVICRLL
jgi:hypothetical protein